MDYQFNRWRVFVASRSWGLVWCSVCSGCACACALYNLGEVGVIIECSRGAVLDSCYIASTCLYSWPCHAICSQSKNEVPEALHGTTVFPVLIPCDWLFDKQKKKKKKGLGYQIRVTARSQPLFLNKIRKVDHLTQSKVGDLLLGSVILLSDSSMD